MVIKITIKRAYARFLSEMSFNLCRCSSWILGRTGWTRVKVFSCRDSCSAISYQLKFPVSQSASILSRRRNNNDNVPRICACTLFRPFRQFIISEIITSSRRYRAEGHREEHKESITVIIVPVGKLTKCEAKNEEKETRKTIIRYVYYAYTGMCISYVSQESTTHTCILSTTSTLDLLSLGLARTVNKLLHTHIYLLSWLLHTYLVM